MGRDASIDAHIASASAMVGLTIADDWRPGVARFLGIAASMAAILDAVPLDDAELAVAPVYRLPDPPGAHNAPHPAEPETEAPQP